MIDSYSFELNQFNGAAVTYRPDGSVAFDGKLWDNHVGVDGVTSGELAAGQAGGDPGDQLTLQDRTTPDWFQLTYAGDGLLIGGSTQDTFVVYEITSSSSGVDLEGTSFRISFNGGAFINASMGTATFLKYTPAAENVNQIAFDLGDYGFLPGDALKTVRIENLDSGSGTSDPDFIFTALEGPGTFAPGEPVPEPASIFVWIALLFGMVVAMMHRRRQRNLTAVN